MEEKKAEIEKLVEAAQADERMFGVMIDKVSEVVTSFNSENHEDAIAKGLNVLTLMDEPRKKFLTVTLGYSLAASIEVVAGISATGVDTKAADEIINKAADDFIAADFEKVNESLAKLPDMITELKKKQEDAAKTKIEKLKKFIEEVKGIEADTSTADAHMAKANTALASKDFASLIKEIEEGTKAAEDVKKARIEAIEGEMENAKGMIDEAQAIGVDVAEPVKIFTQAEKAFKAKDYKKAADSAKEAEELANKLEEDQIKKVEEIKARRQSRGQSTSSESSAQPAAAEAAADSGIVKPAMGAMGGDEDTEGDTDKEEKAEESLDDVLGRQIMPDDSADDAEDEMDGLGGMGTALSDPLKADDAPAAASEKPEVLMCETCGNAMRYIEQYEKYWCDACKKYK